VGRVLSTNEKGISRRRPMGERDFFAVTRKTVFGIGAGGICPTE